MAALLSFAQSRGSGALAPRSLLALSPPCRTRTGMRVEFDKVRRQLTGDLSRARELARRRRAEHEALVRSCLSKAALAHRDVRELERRLRQAQLEVDFALNSASSEAATAQKSGKVLLAIVRDNNLVLEKARAVRHALMRLESNRLMWTYVMNEEAGQAATKLPAADQSTNNSGQSDVPTQAMTGVAAGILNRRAQIDDGAAIKNAGQGSEVPAMGALSDVLDIDRGAVQALGEQVWDPDAAKRFAARRTHHCVSVQPVGADGTASLHRAFIIAVDTAEECAAWRKALHAGTVHMKRQETWLEKERVARVAMRKLPLALVGAKKISEQCNTTLDAAEREAAGMAAAMKREQSLRAGRLLDHEAETSAFERRRRIEEREEKTGVLSGRYWGSPGLCVKQRHSCLLLHTGKSAGYQGDLAQLAPRAHLESSPTRDLRHSKLARELFAEPMPKRLAAIQAEVMRSDVKSAAPSTTSRSEFDDFHFIGSSTHRSRPSSRGTDLLSSLSRSNPSFSMSHMNMTRSPSDAFDAKAGSLLNVAPRHDGTRQRRQNNAKS